MSKSVTIEIGDTEYEIEVPYYFLGVPPQDWDPGAGSEIDIGDEVRVWDHDDKGLAYIKERIKLNDFLDNIYADFECIEEPDRRSKALRKLEDYCLEHISDQMKDEYDDSDV